MHFEMSKVCSNLCYPKSKKTLQISILNAYYEYVVYDVIQALLDYITRNNKSCQLFVENDKI